MRHFSASISVSLPVVHHRYLRLQSGLPERAQYRFGYRYRGGRERRGLTIRLMSLTSPLRPPLLLTTSLSNWYRYSYCTAVTLLTRWSTSGEEERERGVTTSGTNTGPWLYTPGLCIYVMPDSASISSGFNLNVIAVPVIASSEKQCLSCRSSLDHLTIFRNIFGVKSKIVSNCVYDCIENSSLNI